MAQINQSTEMRFRGLSSGLWATINVDLEHDEATAAAAIVAAIGAASASAPPPADVVVPAVCADRAAEIVRNNGSEGVHIVIDCPVAAVGSWEVKSITPRSRPAPPSPPSPPTPPSGDKPGHAGAGGNGPKHNH